MKATSLLVFFCVDVGYYFSSCVNDEVAVPKLKCNQADLLVTISCRGSCKCRGIVSQYTYDDVVEAYVVSTDEFGNFSYISFNFGYSHTAVGFSIPCRCNKYLALDLEIKYLKKKTSTLILITKFTNRWIYVNSYNEGARPTVSK
jgi:hypothetical protein